MLSGLELHSSNAEISILFFEIIRTLIQTYLVNESHIEWNTTNQHTDSIGQLVINYDVTEKNGHLHMLRKSRIKELGPEEDGVHSVGYIGEVSMVELHTGHVLKEVIPPLAFSPVPSWEESTKSLILEFY